MIGMYAPSFFTGSLISRFGVMNVILAGIVLLFVCIVSALAGTGLFNFWAALFLLAMGLLVRILTIAQQNQQVTYNHCLSFAHRTSGAITGLAGNKNPPRVHFAAHP